MLVICSPYTAILFKVFRYFQTNFCLATSAYIEVKLAEASTDISFGFASPFRILTAIRPV